MRGRLAVSALCVTAVTAGILTVGTRSSGPRTDRLQSDAAFTVDTGFGRSGVVIQAGSNGASGVAVVPSGVAGAGSIVTAGSDGTHFQVARFTSAGALDASFGGGFSHALNGSARAVAVVAAGVSGAGDVVAAGSLAGSSCGAQVPTPVVVEYLPNGTQNTHFGVNGVVKLACPAQGGVLNGVAVEPTGKIDVAGVAFGTAGATSMLVASMTSVGGSPTSATTLAGGTGAAANAVAFSAASGDVVAAGWALVSGVPHLTVAAFKSGVLDTAFDTTGFVTSGVTGSSAGGVVALPNGNVVAAGTTNVNGGRFLLTAYSQTGAAAAGFGSGGQVSDSPALGTVDALSSLAFEPSTNLLSAAGFAGTSTAQSLVVAQYNASTGAANHSFGSGGAITRSFGSAAVPATASASSVAVSADGKTVAAGRAPVVNAVDGLALMRVFGPVITMSNPALVKVTTTNPITVHFPVKLSEPLPSSVAALFCVTPGASVNGQGRCGTFTIAAGLTNASVPVRIPITVAPGHAEVIRLQARPADGLSPDPLHSVGVGTIQRLLPPPPYKGYWMVASDGGVFNFGTTHFFGSTGNVNLTKPIVGIAATPRGDGYWLVASDGGIFAFGRAAFHGSTGNVHLTKPIVGMAPTPDGRGYWLVASDGGIFAFGDARFLGSTGNVHLAKPIVGMAATPDGKGYWLVASDGGIFSFGDAAFAGSTGNVHLTRPIVGMAAYPGATGYWLVASDGGIFAFGGAGFHGSTGNVRLAKPIVGMAATPSGDGYWLVASDGGIFAFGNARFFGSTGNVRLAKPIVGMF